MDQRDSPREKIRKERQKKKMNPGKEWCITSIWALHLICYLLQSVRIWKELWNLLLLLIAWTFHLGNFIHTNEWALVPTWHQPERILGISECDPHCHIGKCKVLHFHGEFCEWIRQWIDTEISGSVSNVLKYINHIYSNPRTTRPLPLPNQKS